MLTPTAPIIVVDDRLSHATFKADLGAPVIFFERYSDFIGFFNSYRHPLMVIINPSFDESAAFRLVKSLVESAVAVAITEHIHVDSQRFLEAGCIDVVPSLHKTLCQSMVRRWARFLKTVYRSGSNFGDLVKLRRETIESQVRPNVALIDDSYEDAVAVSAALSERFAVKWVAKIADLESGVATGKSYDLILLDLFFAGEKEGFRILEAIRSNPALKDVPVVFHSANSSERSIASAYALGASDYIEKGLGVRRAAAVSNKLLMHVADAKIARLQHTAM